MKRQWLILALLFGLGLSAVSGTRAVSDPADRARISRLISELASTRFSERRQASRELDAIGEPALDALRQAVSHADMEICHRAKALVARIEKRLDTAAVLAPTRVRLVCKDMPVTDAIAELAKKAKIEILIDPASKVKLAKRKITMDTGEVTFWEALDVLCATAGLVETHLPPTPIRMRSYTFTPQVIVPPQPLKPLILPARPAIKLLPQKPNGVQIQPQKPKAQPRKPKQAQPQKTKEVQAQPQKPEAAKAKEAPQPQKQKVLPAEAAKRAVIRKLVIKLAQPLPQAQILRPQIRLQQAQVQLQQAQMQLALIDISSVVVNEQVQDNSRIVLADGKPEMVPTWYSGAFRIRARASAGQDKESAAITFEVTAEPRQLGWNIVGKPRLEKARDSHGQSVTLILEQPPNQVVMNQWGGRIRMAAQVEMAYFTNQSRSPPLKRTVQIQIKLGEKPGKLLEEMSGRITVEAKTGPQALIVVDSILTAGGKTTKGARGGSINVIEVIKDKNGNHQVCFKVNEGGLVAARAFFFSCMPPSGAPADRANVRLVDARGVSFALIGRSLTNINGAEVQTLTFKAQNGLAPAKLVFSAPLTVIVDVPFSFKGLKLP
jgi:hypothetical protein